MKIYEYNGLTDEHIVRDATPEEIAQREIDAKRAKKELAAIQAEADAKEAQRQEILDRLGITADEAKLLLS
jgi:hypothetical protein